MVAWRRRSKPKIGAKTVKGTALSLVAEGLTVKGELAATGRVRVDGTVEGNVTAPGVAVGATGTIKGDIDAETAWIEGTVTGQIKAKSVILARTARVAGDVFHGSLRIEPGASINGRYRPLEPAAPFFEGGAEPGLLESAASRGTATEFALAAPTARRPSLLDRARAAGLLAVTPDRAAVVLSIGVAVLALTAMTKPQLGRPLAAADRPTVETVAGVAAPAVSIERAEAAAVGMTPRRDWPLSAATPAAAEPAHALPRTVREGKPARHVQVARASSTARRAAVEADPWPIAAGPSELPLPQTTSAALPDERPDWATYRHETHGGARRARRRARRRRLPSPGTAATEVYVLAAAAAAGRFAAWT